MAPREVPKAASTLRAQRLVKTVSSKSRSSPASPATLKKAVSNAKTTIEKVPLKMSNITQERRQRTNTVPKIGTPKSKEPKSAPTPGSVNKSAKKPTYKRRPAHSGVPVPEKMKQLIQKLQYKDVDDL